MIIKEKKGFIIALLISLMVYFSFFIYPVYAAEASETYDGIEDSMTTEQDSFEEEIVDEVTENEETCLGENDQTLLESDINEDEKEIPEDDGYIEQEQEESNEEGMESSEKPNTETNADIEMEPVTESDKDISIDSSEIFDEVTISDDSDTKKESQDSTESITEKETSSTVAANNTKEAAVTEKPMPFERPLKDGTYIIVSKINGFKALQTEGGSKDAGKQIELRDCDGSNTQKFKLVSDAATGYYFITNVQSGKRLAVKNNSTKAGTSIIQNTDSSSLGQKWILVKKNGYFEIQSALDGSPLLLTLKNGSTANGTDVVLDEAKNAASQLFSFLISKPSVTISEGVYEINSALNSNMKLDISNANMNDKGNLQIYQSNGTNAQKFIVTKAGGNQYIITSYNSGKAIDLNAASKSAKVNVQQFTKNGTAAQKWIIRNVGDGTLYITSPVSGYPLEVKDGKATNRSNVYVNKASGSKAQKFTFTKIADSKLKPITEGVYLIRSAKNNNRVIAVEDGSRLQRANIQLQYNDNASFQKFKFIYAGNGYYKIQNVKSKHMIDLKDASYSNKANIQQWHDNGNQAQLWLPHKNSNGSFSFISAKSSRVLDAENGSTADAANIWAYSFNNTDAQKFKLTKTSGSDSTAINNGIVKTDSVLSAMYKKAQDYSSETNYLVLCNVTKHRLVLFKESEGRWLSVMDSPISVGKASTPTPTGTFTVYNHWKYFDGDYNDSYLTYQCWWSTCFYGSYYFHSVLYDYDSGYPGTIRDGRMNVNVSHGCVRMPLEKAEYLYDHSPIGTKVRVYE